MAGTPKIERESKYSLVEAPPDAATVVALGRGGSYAFVEAGVATHTDTYFDDERGTLRRAGLALRRRVGAGGGAVATVKSEGRVEGAWHRREEIEAPLEGDDWPVPVARALARHVALWRLRPRLELEVERSSYLVLCQGRPLGTLAFDRVSARLPGVERSAHFDEVELEALGDADLAELSGAIALLEGVTPLTPSPVSKVQRAVAALSLGVDP